MVDRFIFDNDFIVQLTPKSDGGFFIQDISMGMGVSGIAFCFEILLRNSDCKINNSVACEFNLQYISNLNNYLRYISQNDEFKLNPISHGFASGASGAIYFLVLNSLRNKTTVDLNSYLNDIADIYRNFNLSQIDKSFYGGIAGILFSLLYPNRLGLKLKFSENASNLIFNLSDCLLNHANSDLIADEKNIGFAWGLSGLAFALMEYYKFSNNEIFLKKSQELIDLEDLLINQRSMTYSSKGIQVTTNFDSWVKNNSFCYGEIGLLLSRKAIYSENYYFLNKNQSLLSRQLTNNYTFCCGYSSIHELVSNFKNDNQNVNISSYLDLSDDLSFLSGLAGYLYYYLQLGQKSKIRLFGNTDLAF